MTERKLWFVYTGQSNAASRLLVLAVVARSYVDGPTSADTSGTIDTVHGLVQLRLLSVRQKDVLAILWTRKLALVIETSSSLAIGSSRVQASRVTELQCEQPLQVNKNRSPSSLDPP